MAPLVRRIEIDDERHYLVMIPLRDANISVVLTCEELTILKSQAETALKRSRTARAAHSRTQP